MRCRAGHRAPAWPTTPASPSPAVSGNGTADPPGPPRDPAPAKRAGRTATAGAGDGGVDPEEAARQICLRLLAAAPRTRAQLASALRRRRVPDEVADAVLGRFAEVRLIDDAAFAQAWVETRHHGRGLARRALSAELRQRGVAAEEVRAAVGSLGDGAAAGGEAGRGVPGAPAARQGAPSRRHPGPQGIPGRAGLPGGTRGAGT